MANPSTIYVDPGSTDAIPVYLIVASGINQFLPRSVLNDSSGNEITTGNPLNVVSTAVTVNQGTSPWLVNASLVGVPAVNASVPGIINAIVTVANNVSGGVTTVFQGGAPWTVNASLLGAPTVYQGTSPWTVSGTVTIGAGASSVTITNVTLITFATVYQGGAPWIVNASIVGTPAVSVGNTVAVSGTFWQTNQPVTASIVGSPTVNAVGSGGAIAAQANPAAIGATVYSNISLVATCVTVKSSSANMYGYHFYNSGSSVAFISLFAATQATMGSTTPALRLAVPAGGWADTLTDLPTTFGPGFLIGASASINGSGNPASPVLANVYYL